ncbi:MAG: CBS domain-containing protein [Candidatus Omnitrophica bacterium]|nr:CBS domain-containing protein [Candidatus Omnitrophota bacterium]
MVNVKEVMNTSVIKVKRSTSLRALLDIFKQFHTHPLIPVVDDQDILIGMVYPENLLDILRPQQAKLFRSLPFMEMDQDVFDLDVVPSMGDLIIVDDIMDKHFVVAKETQTIEQAYKHMRMHQKERLAVVDSGGKILGIVGIFDIIWRMFKEKGIA